MIRANLLVPTVLARTHWYRPKQNLIHKQRHFQVKWVVTRFLSRTLGNVTGIGQETNKEGGADIPETTTMASPHSWSSEWKSNSIGARMPRSSDQRITQLLFCQMGFGVDQHGSPDTSATKAAVRAVRNAIEFNSIPGIIRMVPGGRNEMLICVKLGLPKPLPPKTNHSPHPPVDDHEKGKTTEYSMCDEKKDGVPLDKPMKVDLSQVAKVFPYGRLLPIETVIGGLSFPTGRLVHELGDEDDVAICCAACVMIGYDDRMMTNDRNKDTHEVFDTRDGH